MKRPTLIAALVLGLAAASLPVWGQSRLSGTFAHAPSARADAARLDSIDAALEGLSERQRLSWGSLLHDMTDAQLQLQLQLDVAGNQTTTRFDGVPCAMMIDGAIVAGDSFIASKFPCVLAIRKR